MARSTTLPTQLSTTTWRQSDTMWMLGLYGTAIGAGVLFLPINAGVGGLLPLLMIMAILAFPMTYLPSYTTWALCSKGAKIRVQRLFYYPFNNTDFWAKKNQPR